MTEQPVVVALDSPSWCVGDVVTGVVWLRDTPQVARARAMRVSLELRGVRAVLSERHVGERLEGPVHRELRFRLTLPPGGPISWVGKQLALEWWLVAELVLPAWELNPVAQVRFQVLPRGAVAPRAS